MVNAFKQQSNKNTSAKATHNYTRQGTEKKVVNPRTVATLAQVVKPIVLAVLVDSVMQSVTTVVRLVTYRKCVDPPQQLCNHHNNLSQLW